jgi:nicotinamidase-related amidase
MHCVEGEEGWKLDANLQQICESREAKVYCKETFGSESLANDLREIHKVTPIDEIELCGLCTDICVVSNVLMARAYLPNTPITVDASCCAGTTLDKHMAALEVMKSCQINVTY